MTLELVACPRRAGAVAAGLEQRWSPAEVAARPDWPSTTPDDPEMRVSHETIYASLYRRAGAG